MTLALVLSASSAWAQASPCTYVPKDEPFVMVTSPVAGARVKQVFNVSGCSRTFESTVLWTVTVRGGKELARGTAKGGGANGSGPLRFAVGARVRKPTLAYLEVIEPNAKGGPPASRVIVPIVISP